MASAGTDEDPASAIGAIRPDQRIQGRAEDTAAEEQAMEAPARGEEAAQAPVTVTDAPPIAPEEPSAAAKATTDTDEIENFAVRRKRLQGRRIKLQGRRNKERRSSRWTAFILVLFAFNVALIGARSEVVRFFPQTASLFAAVGLPVNLRHLKSENYADFKRNAGRTVGPCDRRHQSPAKPPRCLSCASLHATPPDRKSIREMLCQAAAFSGLGEKLDFRSRFVSPPSNATDVMVRFFTPQDSAAAAK